MQTQPVTNDSVKNNVPTAKQAQPQRQPEPRVATPAVDILEHADGFILLADLPGANAEDLSIHLENDTLTVTALRKPYVQGGIPVLYKRAFVIPNQLDTENVEAKLDAGVLSLKIPRRASARPRQIRVTTG